VYERLVEDDVQTLAYFPAERGYHQLVLVAGEPHLATIDTVPMTLEPLSPTRFITTAVQLLAEAEADLEAVIVSPDDFPDSLKSRAHDLRVVQQITFC